MAETLCRTSKGQTPSWEDSTAYRVPCRIPLVKPMLPQLGELLYDLHTMLESGRLTNFGPFVEDLEARSAELLNVPFAISVCNATTGLCLLLNTLPKGSEVIVPSFTFLPTVQAIVWNGLVPCFADIDPGTYCLSPRSVREKITNNTSAILAVNVFGSPCAMGELQTLAEANGLLLFFDSAHAFGSQYTGSYLGGFGDAEVFSFSATKVLPGGEGGLVTTRHAEMWQAISDRRNYGFASDQDCRNMGLNGKMTEFAALLCTRGLESLPRRVRVNNEIARKYRTRLSKVPGLSFQTVSEGGLSTYKDFTILVEPGLFGASRDDLSRALARRGVETCAYFWPPVHRLTYFRQYADESSLPNTVEVASRVLSLPMHSDLSEEDLECVVSSIEAAFLARVRS